MSTSHFRYRIGSGGLQPPSGTVPSTRCHPMTQNAGTAAASNGDPSLLVVDSGHELVRPSFKRTIVHEDVDPPLLWNLDPRRKHLQPTDAGASLAWDEHPITALQWPIPERIHVPLFGMPCFRVTGKPRWWEGHGSSLDRRGGHVQQAGCPTSPGLGRDAQPCRRYDRIPCPFDQREGP